jgi:hypothetical protein
MILSRRMALLMAPSLILICAEGVAQTPAQDSASVPLMPMPTSVAELIPQTKGLEVARVEGEVILVDPRSKQVLSVVTPEP